MSSPPALALLPLLQEGEGSTEIAMGMRLAFHIADEISMLLMYVDSLSVYVRIYTFLLRIKFSMGLL